MENGETLEEVRRILESRDPVPQSVVNRISLSIIADIYKAQKENIQDEKIKHAAIDKDIAELKKYAIIFWIRDNRPIVVLLFTLLAIVLIAAPNILVIMVAKALGVPYP